MNNKFKGTIILALIVIVVFSFITWLNGWKVTRMFRADTMDLDGEFVAGEGDLIFSPDVMTVDYRGITMKIRYEIGNSLRDKGFYIKQPFTPNFTLKINPEIDDEDGWVDRGRIATEVLLKNDNKGYYLEAFFANKEFPYEEGEPLRLYLYNTSLYKNVEKRLVMEAGSEPKTLEIEGVGTYTIESLEYDEEEPNTLKIKTRAISNLKYPLHFYDKVYVELNGSKVRTGGGSGQGNLQSDSPLIYIEEKGYRVDEPFKSSEDITIDVQQVSLFIEGYTYSADSGGYIDLY